MPQNGALVLTAKKGKADKTILERVYEIPQDGEGLEGKATAELAITVSRNYQSLRVTVGGSLPVESSVRGVVGGQLLLLDLCERVLEERKDWIVETLSDLQG